jgi:peptide-methionine (R)-S-oxide reductase
MRFRPIFSTFVYTLSTFTRAHHPVRVGLATSQPLRLRASMSGIPLIGALFGSSSKSREMSYPDQRSKDEWKAVLNKGQ